MGLAHRAAQWNDAPIPVVILPDVVPGPGVVRQTVEIARQQGGIEAQRQSQAVGKPRRCDERAVNGPHLRHRVILDHVTKREALWRPGTGPRPLAHQHAGTDACWRPSAISLRQVGPSQVSVGIQRLPPNHGLLRLGLVQSMPTPAPSASLSKLVNQSRVASAPVKRLSTWKPMNEAGGACRTKRQKYSSTGRVASGIGAALTYIVAFAGATAGRPLFRPAGLIQGNRKRFAAG